MANSPTRLTNDSIFWYASIHSTQLTWKLCFCEAKPVPYHVRIREFFAKHPGAAFKAWSGTYIYICMYLLLMWLHCLDIDVTLGCGNGGPVMLNIKKAGRRPSSTKCRRFHWAWLPSWRTFPSRSSRWWWSWQAGSCRSSGAWDASPTFRTFWS